ncbi:13094_t:CDS:2, partial [Dentiscutata erythropus]
TISNMSTISVPASTATEDKNVPTLIEAIKELKPNDLIEFLRREKDLQLDEDDFQVFRNEKITGGDFLIITENRLLSYGIKGGPAMRISNFVKKRNPAFSEEIKKGKIQYFLFFSYKTWSLDHYVTWILDNYGCTDELEAHYTFFYDVINAINRDSSASREHDINRASCIWKDESNTRIILGDVTNLIPVTGEKRNRNYYTTDAIGTSPKKEKISANSATTFKTGPNVQYPPSRK